MKDTFLPPPTDLVCNVPSSDTDKTTLSVEFAITQAVLTSAGMQPSNDIHL